MRVPHEYFIRYLITIDQELSSINRTLRSYGLPEIEQTYYAHIRSEVSIPMDFVGRDRQHVPSRNCLRNSGITELWFKEDYPYVAQGFQILKETKIRQVVDSLAATPATFEQIAQALNDKFGYVVAPDTIMFYTRVFCNYGLMSPDEIRTYAEVTKEYWRVAAMEGDMELLMYHLGFAVTVKTEKIVRDVLQMAYFKMRELKHLPTPYGAKAFGEYVKGVQWGTEQIQSSQDKLSSLTKALQIRYDVGEDEVYKEPLPNQTQAIPAETTDAKVG